LTRTATRRPDEFVRTWFNSEVFPAPKNPPTIVTGTGVESTAWTLSALP
jgi:hypothetical protein